MDPMLVSSQTILKSLLYIYFHHKLNIHTMKQKHFPVADHQCRHGSLTLEFKHLQTLFKNAWCHVIIIFIQAKRRAPLLLPAVVFYIDYFRCSQMCVAEFPPLQLAPLTPTLLIAPQGPGNIGSVVRRARLHVWLINVNMDWGRRPGRIRGHFHPTRLAGGKCDGPLSAGPHTCECRPSKETQTGRKYKNAHGQVIETQLEAQLWAGTCLKTQRSSHPNITLRVMAHTHTCCGALRCRVDSLLGTMWIYSSQTGDKGSWISSILASGTCHTGPVFSL